MISQYTAKALRPSVKATPQSKLKFFETSFLGSFNRNFRQPQAVDDKQLLAQLDRTKMYLKSASEYSRRVRSKDRKEKIEEEEATKQRTPLKPAGIAKIKPVTAFRERRVSSPQFGKRADLSIKNFYEALAQGRRLGSVDPTSRKSEKAEKPQTSNDSITDRI